MLEGFICAIAFMGHYRQAAGPIIRSGWFVHETWTVRGVDSEIHLSVDTQLVKCTGLFPLPCFTVVYNDFMTQLFPDTSAVAGARTGAVVGQIPVWKVCPWPFWFHKGKL